MVNGLSFQLMSTCLDGNDPDPLRGGGIAQARAARFEIFARDSSSMSFRIQQRRVPHTLWCYVPIAVLTMASWGLVYVMLDDDITATVWVQRQAGSSQKDDRIISVVMAADAEPARRAGSQEAGHGAGD